MKIRVIFLFLAILGPTAAFAQTVDCDSQFAADAMPCYDSQLSDQQLPPVDVICPDDPIPSPATVFLPVPETHRSQPQILTGLASYYSDFFDGRRTANGEIFHQARFSAAHRTLPFGTVIEVRSIVTGKSIRLRVNDRGPFKGGFTLDLSRAAAHAIGVDVTEDRTVEIRILSTPGQAPDSEEASVDVAATPQTASVTTQPAE